MHLTTVLLRRCEASNFRYWKRYVDRRQQAAYERREWHPIVGWQGAKRRHWYYDEHRPWSDEFLRQNQRLAPRDCRQMVKPIKDWKIFHGDRNAIGGAAIFKHHLPSLTSYIDRQSHRLKLQKYSGARHQLRYFSYWNRREVFQCQTKQERYRSMATAQVPRGILFGLGNPLLDITIKTDESFLKKYDLKANNAIIAGPRQMPMFAEMMRDFKPQYHAGGATQNSIRVAQWLLQTAGATTFFGGVGNDERAAILKSKAEESGVTVRYDVSDLAPTGTCGAVITGENRSLVAHLGAADFFAHSWMEEREQWKFVELAKFFYIGGFVFPVCHGGIFEIAKHVCENNKTLIMNLSAPFLCKYYADATHNIMQYVDILFGNESEAAEFCKLQGISSTDIEDMALQTSLLPKANQSRERIVVFTQGKNPTIVASAGKVHVYPTAPVPKELIRDTNGCGDAFVGGFLSQLVQGKGIDECVRCGKYAARYVIQQWGCTLPDKPNFV